MCKHAPKIKLPDILLAPDAYKGCLGADAVARAMGEGVRRILPEAKLRAMPMADGGEGSLDVLLAARGGERHVIELPGPDGSPLRAAWGLFSGTDGQEQAVIETAQVVGLPLAGDVPVERRGSQGVGVLMRHCMDRGIRHFIVCLGGSGSNDGGAGLLAALGLRLLNDKGRDVRGDLSGLADLARLDAGALDQRLASCRIDLMCDVPGPLCGSQGATAVYGPQKGVLAAKVSKYDARLRHFASLCEACFGVAVMDEPGAGAAGGLGFALRLLGGSYHAGASMMADALGLDAALKHADLVFTGEGRTDTQSLCGKVVCEVARRARRFSVPVALLSGRLDVDIDDRWRVFDQMLAASPESMSLEKAMLSAPALIADAVERMLRMDHGLHLAGSAGINRATY